MNDLRSQKTVDGLDHPEAIEQLPQLMAQSSRELINRAILGAMQESGAAVMRVSTERPSHPRKYLYARDGEQSSLWVYCWTLTHGGRKSLPNEYRIQITSVESPLPINPDGFTLLLGYKPDLGVFAGFDIDRHREFAGWSPSVQVNLSTLNEALQNGLSFQMKSNNEVVTGIRNDMLLCYCEQASELHNAGGYQTFLESVNRAVTSQDLPDNAIESLPKQRRQVVSETFRWSRASRFAKQVLTAYDNRCAVTRQKLKLVDAAHILPVKAGERSIDHVRNGIALSPTYHRAFDRGLIYLDRDMVMHLNVAEVNELSQMDLADGINEFAAHLGKIHLPYNLELRPDPYFILLANRFRGLG